MNLTFFDRTPAADTTAPALTISRNGEVIFNTPAVKHLGLLPDESRVALAFDEDGATWWLAVGEPAGRKAVILRQRRSGGEQLYFKLSAATTAFFTHFKKHLATTQRSVCLPLELHALAIEGTSLYLLNASGLRPSEKEHSAPKAPDSSQAKKGPAKPHAKVVLAGPAGNEVKPAPMGEGVRLRITKAVRELGGLLLDKVDDTAKTRALGLLSRHRAHLEEVPGAADLFQRLAA